MKKISATSTDIRAKPSCPKCGVPMVSGVVGMCVRKGNCISAAERFWAKVEKHGPDECWPWRGAITSQHGYGNTAWEGHHLGAHKVAWILTNGYVPEGKCVLHKCDNRVCCNPGHFYLGSKVDNSLDKMVRGRDPFAKLTPDHVREIRAALSGGGWGINRKLAKQYGVLPGVICDIRKGHTYQWVK